MRYREFRPHHPLTLYVECFWTLESETSTLPVQTERILPDGCVELILNFGEPFSQHEATGHFVQPQHFLVGQMTRPIFISPTGVVDLVGIRFHPGGAVPFVRTPMHEITDQVTELSSITPRWERELLSVCTDVNTLKDRVEAIEGVLIDKLISSKHESRTLALAAKIVDYRGLISVDQLAQDAGISSRQLERRFLSEVGLGPKLLSRIMRFQQVFRAIESCDGAWGPVAAECGYYDQAHLIRDFRQFAHQTPSVLFAQHNALTESFTRKSRTSDFSNT
jgi:AraC-like DNA-binding protein